MGKINFVAILMGAFYVIAGVLHFINPAVYLKMMPAVIPYPLAMVYISGVVEIVLGIGVCIPATRKAAAWGLILLLIAILPANINMALNTNEWNFSPILLYLRLPLQLVFIRWAYRYTK